MISPIAERAVSDCIQYERALLKFVSANDAGATGAHQCGFYLPISLHALFTVHPPTRGVNSKHHVQITWEDGRKTKSVVTWYGVAKREYRLTKFGREFPFLNPDMVGSLFVLIPTSKSEFNAYVFDTDDDIEFVQSSLGVEVIESWAHYKKNFDEQESDEECIQRQFRKIAAGFSDFPSGKTFSLHAWNSLVDCVSGFESILSDDRVIRLVQEEYNLFRLTERKLCGPLIHRMFSSVDDFLETASSIMNRRKSRAGRALENHIESIFSSAGIPFEVRPDRVDGRPDVVVPSSEKYFDDGFPEDQLFVICVKTTCKDRWRQILNEGKRKKQKHLITLQQGISKKQLDEMFEANVQLVVPKKIQKLYPPGSKMKIIGIEDLISKIRIAGSNEKYSETFQPRLF